MTNYSEIFERVEEKYLLDAWQFDEFEGYLDGHAESGMFGKTLVMSLYYDTPSHEVIERSLEKPLYKEKLRVRSYGVPAENDKVYVELKKKYKGIVYKRRIAMTLAASRMYLAGMPFEQACAQHPLVGEDAASALDVAALQTIGEIDSFIARHPGLAPAMLITSVREEYLGSDDNNLRITIDRDIRWRANGLDLALGAGGRELLASSKCLMEIKCSGAYRFDLVDALESIEAYPCNFSKYGNAYIASCARVACVPQAAQASSMHHRGIGHKRGAHSVESRVLQSA